MIAGAMASRIGCASRRSDLHEGHEQSVLHVVVARDGKGHLGPCRLECLARNETPAVGEHLLQRYGEGLGTRRRQHAPLGAHEQGIAEEVTQPCQHPADRRLRVTEARGRPRDVALVEQHIEHDQQVQIDLPDIVHDNIRTMILRLQQYQRGRYVIRERSRT